VGESWNKRRTGKRREEVDKTGNRWVCFVNKRKNGVKGMEIARTPCQNEENEGMAGKISKIMQKLGLAEMGGKTDGDQTWGPRKSRKERSWIAQ